MPVGAILLPSVVVPRSVPFGAHVCCVSVACDGPLPPKLSVPVQLMCGVVSNTVSAVSPVILRTGADGATVSIRYGPACVAALHCPEVSRSRMCRYQVPSVRAGLVTSWGVNGAPFRMGDAVGGVVSLA